MLQIHLMSRENLPKGRFNLLLMSAATAPTSVGVCGLHDYKIYNTTDQYSCQVLNVYFENLWLIIDKIKAYPKVSDRRTIYRLLRISSTSARVASAAARTAARSWALIPSKKSSAIRTCLLCRRTGKPTNACLGS